MTGTVVAPVVDDIPFLRAGRDELATEAAGALERGDRRRALAVLLTDRDDWAPGEPPTVEDALEVVDAVDGGATLRDAMDGLRFGPVADYFAHRWSDPTYLSGLALLDVAWPSAPSPRVVEVACGIGQLLAAARDAGASVVGVDVVFAKLWLARRFVVPEADLWCVDVERQPLPLPDTTADLVVVHDALYFLADKRAVLDEAQRVGGGVAVGHAHNALVDNWSSGRPLDPAGWAALLPGAVCFDDAELTAAWLEARRPQSRSAAELADAAAVALVTSVGRGSLRPVGVPPPGRRLARNPLLAAGAGDPVPLTPSWPSARWEAEYGPLSPYLRRREVPAATLALATDGHVDDPDVRSLLRERVVLDLPERW